MVLSLSIHRALPYDIGFALSEQKINPKLQNFDHSDHRTKISKIENLIKPNFQTIQAMN
jgi:hypothetical protein